jgi:hypothetical protein
LLLEDCAPTHEETPGAKKKRTAEKTAEHLEI